MKKILSTMILLLVFSAAFGIKNWKSYTNTTHIYEATNIDGMLYLSTWGGISVFNPATNSYDDIFTTLEGLGENDVRSISKNQVLDQIFVGTRKNGIDRFDSGNFLPAIETSDNISKVICTDSLTFVSNRDGISLYKIISNWPIPVLWDTYTNDNGLSSIAVSDFFVTDDGVLIVATDSGLDIVDVTNIDEASNWHHYNTGNSDLPSNEVLAVYERDGRVVLGTDNGLAGFDIENIDENWTITESGKSVRALYIDKDNNVWHGFGKWENELLQVTDQEEVGIKTFGSSTAEWDSQLFNNSAVMGFVEADDTIFAYFWGEGVYRLKDGNWISYKVNNISASLIKALVIDNDGNLWASNGYRDGTGVSPLPKGTKGVSKYDGTTWVTYNYDNSGIITNNIYSLAVDKNNNIWMGAWWTSTNPMGWEDGISVYQQSSDSWVSLHESDGLRNGTIAGISVDDENRTWVSCAGIGTGGISVFDESFELLEDFELFEPFVNSHGHEMDDPNLSFIGQNALYFGGGITGIRTWKNWNGSNFPVDGGSNWEKPPFNELITGKIYAITSIVRNNLEEIWVGSENGLFQYAYSNVNTNLNSPGYYWFKYAPHIKRSVYWKTSSNSYSWYNTANAFYYYIEGQERLYAGELTFPTAMLVDPFGIIWIGTKTNGLTMYNPDRDVFKTYNTENSPLISNSVTALAYDEITGNLYIGTDDGLSSVQIGIGADFNTETDLKKTIAFPNPFKPRNGELLRIENKDKLTMPKGNTKCSIYDLNGNLIRKLEKDSFEQFSWNGNNEAGKECSSGIYFYLVSASDGQTDRGKIALIR